jgi:hypothetical protein
VTCELAGYGFGEQSWHDEIPGTFNHLVFAFIFTMPLLARKMLVFAALDGLFLQPTAQRTADRDTCVRIEYGSIQITSAKGGNEPFDDSVLEIYGVVGRSGYTPATVTPLTPRQAS